MKGRTICWVANELLENSAVCSYSVGSYYLSSRRLFSQFYQTLLFDTMQLIVRWIWREAHADSCSGNRIVTDAAIFFGREMKNVTAPVKVWRCCKHDICVGEVAARARRTLYLGFFLLLEVISLSNNNCTIYYIPSVHNFIRPIKNLTQNVLYWPDDDR